MTHRVYLWAAHGWLDRVDVDPQGETLTSVATEYAIDPEEIAEQDVVDTDTSTWPDNDPRTAARIYPPIARYFKQVSAGQWLDAVQGNPPHDQAVSVEQVAAAYGLDAADVIATDVAMTTREIDTSQHADPRAGTLIAAPVSPTPPDYNRAMFAGFQSLEGLAPGTADDLLAQFPSFGFAMTAANGPLAWSRLEAAMATGKITQAQHDAVAAAMAANRIPQA